MSPIETQEIVQRISGMTEEQKMIVTQCLPDEMLWNELYSRFFEDRNDLENILKVARDAKLATSKCTPTNG